MGGCVSKKRIKKGSTPDTLPVSSAEPAADNSKDVIKVQERRQTESSNEMHNHQQQQQKNQQEKQQQQKVNPDQQQQQQGRKQQKRITSSLPQQSGNGAAAAHHRDNKTVGTKQQQQQPKPKKPTKQQSKSISKISSNERIQSNKKPQQPPLSQESSTAVFGRIKKDQQIQKQKDFNSSRVFDQAAASLIESTNNENVSKSISRFSSNEQIIPQQRKSPAATAPVIKAKSPKKQKQKKKIKERRKESHQRRISCVSPATIPDIYDITIEGKKNIVNEEEGEEERRRNTRESARITNTESVKSSDCVKVLKCSPAKQKHQEYSPITYPSPLPIIPSEPPLAEQEEEQSEAALLLTDEREGIDLDIERIFAKRKGNRPEDHTLYEISNEIPELSFNLISSNDDNYDNEDSQ